MTIARRDCLARSAGLSSCAAPRYMNEGSWTLLEKRLPE